MPRVTSDILLHEVKGRQGSKLIKIIVYQRLFGAGGAGGCTSPPFWPRGGGQGGHIILNYSL